MQFLAITALFAATALAIPGGAPFSASQQDGKCGNGVKKCCSQQAADASRLNKADHAALLDVLDLSDLLQHTDGNSFSDCEDLVSVNKCNEVTACCTSGDQNGLVNVGCIGIPVQV